MAVTLIEADLIQPTGELESDFFPLGNIDALLAGWLQQAIALVEGNASIAVASHNSAAAAWVYHRAYSHIATRLYIEPADASIESGVSRKIAVHQAAYFAALAATKLAEYEDYGVTVEEEAETPPITVEVVPVW